MNNDAQRLKLLIVEDNPSFRELYEEILGSDYELIIKPNKEEAKTYIQMQAPDIALLDMRLVPDERGNREGLEVAQFMRDLGMDTVIILKSGFPTETPQVQEQLRKLKVFEVLDKSSDNSVKELTDAISKAADQLKRISPRPKPQSTS